MNHVITVEEGDRQMILLALAKLWAERPGWEYAIGLLADKLRGRQMLEEFHKMYRGVPAKDDLLCDSTHAIKEEPKISYLARYPKAVGIWWIKNLTGGIVEKKFCAACGERARRSGWHFKVAILVEPDHPALQPKVPETTTNACQGETRTA